jgi:hypothetical protein
MAQDSQTGNLRIIEENHYYPFGLKHANYNSGKNIYTKEMEILKIKPLPPLLKTSYSKKFEGKSWEDEKLVGIRTNMEDWGETLIGFITEINNSCFTIREIDEYGFTEGNTIVNFENVINIEIDDRYQKRLFFIYKNNSLFNQSKQITIWKDGNLLKEYFESLIQNNTIITFYFDEEDYVTGEILKYDKEVILIQNIGREGDDDGISYYFIDKLIGIRYNGIEEQKIELLYKNRTLFY